MTRISIDQMPEVKSEEQKRHLIRYVNFINSRPERELKQKGFHTHHIYPKSIANKNRVENFNGEWNLIELTPREHFIAHMILFYCGYTEMIYAFRQMCKKNYTNGAIYEKLQKQRGELSRIWFVNYHASHDTSGVNSSRYGVQLPLELKLKLSKIKKGKPNYKLRGYKHSQEAKDNMSKAKVGKKASEETKKKMSISQLNRKTPANTGKVFCQEIRNKMSNISKGKRLITNGSEFRFLYYWQKLPDGWVFYKKINKKDIGRFILFYKRSDIALNKNTKFILAKDFWINNGKNSRKISCFNSAPFKWKKGKLKNYFVKGKLSITNGVENKIISKSDIIPDGWIRGSTHAKSKKQKIKQGCKKWINNGSVEIKINKTDEMPDGFFNGRISKPKKYKSYNLTISTRV